MVKLSGRGTPSIFQQPSAANDYTLIVQFTGELQQLGDAGRADHL
jgi:hypothetical protein